MDDAKSNSKEIEWLEDEELVLRICGQDPDAVAEEVNTITPAAAPGPSGEPDIDGATAEMNTCSISTQTDEALKAERPLRGRTVIYHAED